jgi:hypothetical protein
VNSHRSFKLLRYPPLSQDNVNLKLNGIYIRDEAEVTNQYNFLCLFQDGTMFFGSDLIMGMNNFFWKDPQKYFEQNATINAFTNQNYDLAGHFSVDGDSIRIQYFTTLYQQMISRKLVNFRGVFLDDSSIILGKDELTTSQSVYRFCKVNTKPDSSKIWFKRKRWYQKDVWYNQK